jgi:hypothetical protein
MKIYMRYLLFFIYTVLFFGFALTTNAQSSPSLDIVLTWRAHTYYPANFNGKAEATPGAPVTIGLQVLKDGVIIDPAEMNFVWRLDGVVISRGIGLSYAEFFATATPNTHHEVRVSVSKKGNSLGEGFTTIPVRRPLLVLEHSYPDRILQSGTQVPMRLVPYFFTVSSLDDLRFFWQVDGGDYETSDGDNALVLTVGGLPEGVPKQTFVITGTAQNIIREIEFANTRALFTVISL